MLLLLFQIIQKYNQSKNYGLKFEMIAPNTEEPKMKVGIIIPLICEKDKRTCDIKNILCKHYHQFDQALDNMNREYHVYYIAQAQDGRPVNLGKLYNVGFQIAKKDDCDIFILQSNRTIPNKNIMPYYNSYPNTPICLSAKQEDYEYDDYNLGTMMFDKDDFKKCNGYTNNIWGDKGGSDYSLWLTNGR